MYPGFAASLRTPGRLHSRIQQLQEHFCLVLFHLPHVSMFTPFLPFSFISSIPACSPFRSTEFLFHESFLNICLGSFSPYTFFFPPLPPLKFGVDCHWRLMLVSAIWSNWDSSPKVLNKFSWVCLPLFLEELMLRVVNPEQSSREKEGMKFLSFASCSHLPAAEEENSLQQQRRRYCSL